MNFMNEHPDTYIKSSLSDIDPRFNNELLKYGF